MTTPAIRKKIHQYVDEAEGNVLEVIYKMLKLYSGEGASALTSAQKNELDKTLADHKAGKLKYYTIEQARSQIYGSKKK